MSQQINLLRMRHGQSRELSYTSTRVLAVGVALAILLTCFIAVYENYRLRGVEAEAARQLARLKEVSAAYERKTEPQRKPSIDLEARVRDLERQVKARQEIVDAVQRGLVGTTVGFSEFMRVFSRQSLQGVWLAGFEVAAGGDELTIVGRTVSAELVPIYLQRLNREAVIQGRQFGSMAMKQAAQVAPLEQQASSSAGSRADIPAHLEFTLTSSQPVTSQLARPTSYLPPIPPSPVFPDAK